MAKHGKQQVEHPGTIAGDLAPGEEPNLPRADQETQPSAIAPSAEEVQKNGKKNRRPKDMSNRPLYYLIARKRGTLNADLIGVEETKAKAAREFPKLSSAVGRFYDIFQVIRGKDVTEEVENWSPATRKRGK